MENKLQITNISGVQCYEKDGVAYLDLEAVAKGLGITKKANSGNEVVHWTRLREYLADFGVVQKCTTGDFIPENIFYRLAMKVRGEVAERFQAFIADEVIPSIRRTGGYVANEEVNGVTIKLTEGQRDSLIDFIEYNFYPNIRNDDSIDSIDYAIDLLNVYTRLRSAAKHRRSTGINGYSEAVNRLAAEGKGKLPKD